MKVIKRDGRIDEFQKSKIVNAVGKAFKEVDGDLTEEGKNVAENISEYIDGYASTKGSKIGIEEIQDLVEEQLMASDRKDVAKAYIIYREHRNLARENTIDKAINELIDDQNKYWKDENANKNPMLNTTKRDYMAGIVSTDAVKRYLLPPDIVKAHEEGILHFHDADYFLQHEHNCDLINLDDMLQNGTVISEVLIEKPHKFSTACTITTQIIAQVASNQYGLTE